MSIKKSRIYFDQYVVSFSFTTCVVFVRLNAAAATADVRSVATLGRMH